MPAPVTTTPTVLPAAARPGVGAVLRRMRLRAFAITRAVITAAAATTTVLPVVAADHDAVRRAVEAGQLKPLAEILVQVEARYGGRVLDVELERDASARQVYEIKLLERDGRRREVHIDAVTGAQVMQPADTSSGWVPISSSLRHVLAQYPGKVLDVELDRGPQDKPIYVVRIAQTDGRLREVALDARSGEELVAEERRLAPIGSMKSLPEILDTVLARYPGTVREVELERDRRGRRYYEVDLQLLDGRLVEVNVDAVSGELLPNDPSE